MLANGREIPTVVTYVLWKDAKTKIKGIITYDKGYARYTQNYSEICIARMSLYCLFV